MNCLTGEQKWPQFIKQHFEGIREPFTAGMELLADCNFRCVHCYAESERLKNRESMTLAQIYKMIDILVEHNCIELFLTGGEALLHKNFFEIYKYAKKKGILVSVLSNGSLIRKEHIDLWKEYPPEMISLTMYAASEENYTRITGNKKGYRDFCNAVKMLYENNIPFEIKCIGMKQNYNEIGKIRSFARSYGLKNAVLAWDIRPMNDGNLMPINCRVSPEEAVHYEITDEERRNFWNELALNDGIKELTDGQKERKLYPCAIAQQFVFITHSGRMQGCVKAVDPSYDLLNGNFEKGWEFLKENFIDKIASPNFRCSSCPKFRYCGQCTAAFADENGDPEKPVGFYCQYGELLKEYMEECQ